jgi:HTH-type transcriptional regulator/antitoxin HigA
MGKTRDHLEKLPGRFDELVRVMPPRAISDDIELDNAVEMIDRLMAIPRHTKGQAAYLETLVQLVEVYEQRHHAIDTNDLSGIDTLKYLLDENNLSASDLARLLGIHPSMGSKLLKGQRKLTTDHLRILSDRFGVEASVFL